MEFSGFGTIRPIQGPTNTDVRSVRGLEGGWFVSGPAQVEEMDEIRRKHKKEEEKRQSGFKKKIKTNPLIHQTRMTIINQSATDMSGEDPWKILDKLQTTRSTTSTKAALQLLDTSQLPSPRGFMTSSFSKRSVISGRSVSSHLVTFRASQVIDSTSLTHRRSTSSINMPDYRNANLAKSNLRMAVAPTASCVNRSLGNRTAASANWMPIMSKQDVARYRNSVCQNICQDLLIKGNHKAFAEIFNMIRFNREARDNSARDSPLRQMSLLEHSPRKLEKIKKGLVEVEDIERSYAFHRYRYRALEEYMLATEVSEKANINTAFGRGPLDDDDDDDEDEETEGMETLGSSNVGLHGHGPGNEKRVSMSKSNMSSSVWHQKFTLKGMKHPYTLIFEIRYNLGIYFNSIDDFWCSHYFFNMALEIANKIPGSDSGKKVAECSRAYGRSLENHGFYKEAANNLENYLYLTKKYQWASDDGRSLEKDAYIQLSRIYNSMANEMIIRTKDIEGEENPQNEALNCFHKSYTVAYKAGDRIIESLASYKLGMMLLFAGYPKKCLKYLEVYLYFCQINGNEFGMARALEGIGRALHEQGENYMAMGYLTKFAEIILRKRKEAIQGITTSQWRSDNVQKFIESVRYQILEGSFVRCSRLIGVIYDDQRQYDKAEPFLHNSYQVAKALSDKDNDRYKCSRVQYGIAVAHHLWDDLSATFEHNDCDVKKKLANAKLMTNWRLNRITGFCRPGDNIEPEDVNWEQDFERLEHAAQGVEPEAPIPRLRPTTTSRPSEFGGEGHKTIETASGSLFSEKAREEARKSRTTRAQFTAIERQKASKASTRSRRPRDGSSAASASTRPTINALSPEGFEGPKLPVRVKEQDDRWSAEELVPTWYKDLDINFAEEYSLMGNCMKAGFHPFFMKREKTFGKVESKSLELSVSRSLSGGILDIGHLEPMENIMEQISLEAEIS